MADTEAKPFEPTIDPEIRDLIPALSPEEYARLEANVLADGEIRDKSVIWKETGVLLDGHNRKRISEAHGLPWPHEFKSFPSRDAAKVWVLTNQLGRRNLPPFVRAELALKLEPLIASEAKKRMKAGKRDPGQTSAQGKTSEKVAELAGVSRDTIAKAKVLTEKATDDLKRAVRSNDVTVNAATKLVKAGAGAVVQKAVADDSITMEEALSAARAGDERAQADKLREIRQAKASGKPGKKPVRRDSISIPDAGTAINEHVRGILDVVNRGKFVDGENRIVKARADLLRRRLEPPSELLADSRDSWVRMMVLLEFLGDALAEQVKKAKKRKK